MEIALRIRETGELYVMERGSSGAFEFGDPKFGDRKHVGDNVVLKNTLEEAISGIRSGLHPRMKGQETGQWNMISPANIKIVEVPK